MSFDHIPVLEEEVVGQFDFGRPAVLVDGTLGLGGHTRALLEQYPDLRIVGLDWDPAALAVARERLAAFGERVHIVEGSYTELPGLLQETPFPTVDGVLLDLGLSSLQLSDTSRGFSFLRPGPLDMRMSAKLPRTAWDWLKDQDEMHLGRMFQRYGEEPRGRRVAAELKRRLAAGTLTNDAFAIANVIRTTLGGHRGGADPATRCFQALRIAVNGELDNIQRFLAALPDWLPAGGRAAFIAFHSLEDRLVKQTLAQAVRGCVCPPQAPACCCGQKPWARLLTKKAVKASEAEVERNPRARSARLRVIERLP